MGNFIQDILGLVSRSKAVTPKDKDVVALGRFRQNFRNDNISGTPDMTAEQTTIKDISDYIVAKVPNELPNPGTAGQVLALDSSLQPIWKDDADTTTTIFQNSDIGALVGSYKGDVYVPTEVGIATLGVPHYVIDVPIGGSGISAVNDITNVIQIGGMIGITVSTPSGTGILLKGLVRVSGVALSTGQPVYFVNGGISKTAPSTTGQYVRIAGYCVSAALIGDPIIYFNPSPDFILLS